MNRNPARYTPPVFLILFLLVLLIPGYSDLYSQEIMETDSTTLSPATSRNETEEEGTPVTVLTAKILDFSESSVLLINQLGSFGFYNNGINIAVKTDHYRLFTGYGYRNWDGFRKHSNQYSHTVNIGLETTPSSNSSLKILGSFSQGQVKLPGSLTKAESEQDPRQADPRSVDRDDKRIYTAGRVDIGYESKFGSSLNNKIRISTYGTIDFSRSATREYRIINRYGFGLSAGYSNTTRFGSRSNEFSIGGEAFTQPQRTEYYDNLGGNKGDLIEQLTSEKTVNWSIHLSDRFEILREKLFVTLTGRYDHVVYKLNEETLPSRHERKTFEAFTPTLALNYTLFPLLCFYTSYGLGFESPADKQLESADPFYLYNPDLKAERSRRFELGLTGRRVKKDSGLFFRKISYKASFFTASIDNEIVPYEVFGDEFYRNATRTNRRGLELGGQVEFYEDLSFSFSYTYSQFTYDSYSALSIETDSTGNIVQVSRDFAGKKEPNIPENNLNLSLFYEHALSRHITVVGNVSYHNVTGVWTDDANTGRTGSYELLNAGIGVDVKLGHVKLSCSGGINNIFDKVYTAYVTSNSANNRYYNPGAPGNYYCSLKIGYMF